MVYSSARQRLSSRATAGRRSPVCGIGRVVAATICLFLAWSSPVAAALPHWSPTGTEQDTSPISIRADSIATWKKGSQDYYLVRGAVWIKQGVVNVKFSQGVICIDPTRPGQPGSTQLAIYAEGAVWAEEGGKQFPAGQSSASSAYLELKTRAGLDFPQKNVHPQEQSNDPLFGRAVTGFQEAGLLGGPPPAANITLHTGPTKADATAANGSIIPAPLPLPALPSPVNASATPLPTLPKSVTDAGLVPDDNPFRGYDNLPSKGPIQLVGGSPLPQLPQPNPVSPVAPLTPGGPAVPLMPGVLGGGTGDKFYSIRPRSLFRELDIRNIVLASGETAVVVSPGIILTVTNADGKGGILDVEADALVLWTQGTPQQVMDDLKGSKSQKDRPLEFYLAGNVEIRTQFGKEIRVVRADEVYYDVNRHVSVANHANLELMDPRLVNPIHIQADQVLQLNQNLFETGPGSVNASSLPFDPEVKLSVSRSTLEVRQIIKKTIFGYPIVDRKTGQPVVENQRYFTGYNVFTWLEGVPVFYFPFLQGDAEDPLGPLKNLSIGYNRIFGFQVYTTWDMYNLIGWTAPPDTKWRLHLDVLTVRGPEIGTDYRTTGRDMFGIPNRYNLSLQATGIYDRGLDVIGGNRGQEIEVFPGIIEPVTHPLWRGWFDQRLNIQDLPYGFSVLERLSLISDHNFLEQYFSQEYLNGQNPETYLYVKQQEGSWAWTGLVQPSVRNWVTETEYLPRFSAYVFGNSIFDTVTWNTKADATYARLRTTQEPDFAYLETDRDISTGRFDLWNDFSLPLTAGPVKVVPYGVIDLTYYTRDLDGQDAGRFYGAGGVRAAMPLSRLYPDVQSELFNLDTIFHKIMFWGNAYFAWSNIRYTDLPQIDQLNDNASDQALRDIFPQNLSLNPDIAKNMLTTQLFDPQMYALRRLVLNQIDTRDSMEVVQLGIDQRWQTKRGFPGQEHVVDWMTLNLGASFFPRADRDNFGVPAAFLEYDWTWNIGDRTSLVSSGWVDPIAGGAKVFSIGSYMSRPDGTNFYLGYRQIDPLDSKAVIASVSYVLTQKYSITASAAYDFGIQQESTTLVLTRTGKDLKLSFGFTYNSYLNTFGVVFDIVPILSPLGATHGPGTPGSLVPGGRS